MKDLFETRLGVFGHYIKPYTIDSNNLCVPFPPPSWFDPDEKDNNTSLPGYPGHPTDDKVQDYNLPPNLLASRPQIDFLVAGVPGRNNEPPFHEIGRETLMDAVKQGEELDLAFAYKMQGLLGCTLETVWACMDPSFNPADRADMMNRFVAGYTDGFFKKISWEDQQDPRAVATEELQQHKAWCQVRARACLAARCRDGARRRSGSTSTTRR